jgi:LuxR family quorum-sensing system transcriptional regulator SolR
MELRWQDAYQQFSAAEDEQQLFQRIAAYSKRLGFEYCCYGIRVPLPVSKPAVAIFDTYPTAGWRTIRRATTSKSTRRCAKAH